MNPYAKKVQPTVLLVAWVATLLASSLDVIFWKELTGAVPYWLPLAHAVGLVTIFSVTLVLPTLRRLKGFIFILLIIFFLGYSAGWQWGFISVVRETSFWINWEAQAPWALSAIGTHILRLAPAMVILGFLLITGKKRGDFFLVKGKINAPVDPSKLIGMKKPDPWTRIGAIFAIIFSSATLLYLVASSPP